MEYAPYTEAEAEAFSQAIREFAEKHGIELEEQCWCGGSVGPREPGDERGLGCQANIMHAPEES